MPSQNRHTSVYVAVQGTGYVQHHTYYFHFFTFFLRRRRRRRRRRVGSGKRGVRQFLNIPALSSNKSGV